MSNETLTSDLIPNQAHELLAARTALFGFLGAFENLDWDAFRNCFADDATVFFPAPEPPHRFEGRAAIESCFASVFARIRSSAVAGPPFHRLVPEQLQIQPLGVGFMQATFLLRMADRLARRTVILRRSGEDWHIIHLHASNVQPTQPPEGGAVTR